VAPRPDDLQRIAVCVDDQALLVVHPAIRVIFAAKAILHRVDPILEEFRYSLLYAGQIVGGDPVAPEQRVFQVRGWRIAEDVDDIVADKGGREITGSLKAVNHRG